MFEVSVFGPGLGESILVHLGGDDWVLVDSCVDQSTGSHPALSYLAEMGVDVAERVHLVVGTHAHDDHIAGIGDAFVAARSAKFVCSSALTRDEFYALVQADADISAEFRESIRAEYGKVFKEVAQRGKRNHRAWLTRAVEGRVLWERPQTAAVPAARVTALSPSDRAVTRAIAALARGTAKAGERRRLSSADPNELAVAIWVEVGVHSALLGADLLTGPAGCGWHAVLSSFTPPSRASLFKVPHHGAPNAHHPGVWQNLLSDEPIAVTAPFRGGKRPRPQPDDVTRICAAAEEFWLTAAAPLPAQSAAVKRTAATLSSIATNVRDPHGRPGQVRARVAQADKNWTLDSVPPARAMC